MRMRASGILALAVLVLSGCYHATIETGRTPSGQVVENEWAHGFVYGLVPPSTIETAEECENGVARVETQLSFLNQLASALTFGIYTPMTISVQCAAASTALNVPALSVAEGASTEQARAVVVRAAQLSAEVKEPVYVRFRTE